MLPINDVSHTDASQYLGSKIRSERIPFHSAIELWWMVEVKCELKLYNLRECQVQLFFSELGDSDVTVWLTVGIIGLMFAEPKKE